MGNLDGCLIETWSTSVHPIGKVARGIVGTQAIPRWPKTATRLGTDFRE
jgi:hypothetical protein